MPWAARGNRQYYYRTIWRDGRSVTQYLGRGRAAHAQADLDALRRNRRALQTEDLHLKRARLEALEAESQLRHELVMLLARLTLVAAGYHRHKKGEWRKRRTPKGTKTREVGLSESVKSLPRETRP